MCCCYRCCEYDWFRLLYIDINAWVDVVAQIKHFRSNIQCHQAFQHFCEQLQKCVCDENGSDEWNKQTGDIEWNDLNSNCDSFRISNWIDVNFMFDIQHLHVPPNWFCSSFIATSHRILVLLSPYIANEKCEDINQQATKKNTHTLTLNTLPIRICANFIWYQYYVVDSFTFGRCNVANVFVCGCWIGKIDEYSL